VCVGGGGGGGGLGGVVGGGGAGTVIKAVCGMLSHRASGSAAAAAPDNAAATHAAMMTCLRMRCFLSSRIPGGVDPRSSATRCKRSLSVITIPIIAVKSCRQSFKQVFPCVHYDTTKVCAVVENIGPSSLYFRTFISI